MWDIQCTSKDHFTEHRLQKFPLFAFRPPSQWDGHLTQNCPCPAEEAAGLGGKCIETFLASVNWITTAACHSIVSPSFLSPLGEAEKLLQGKLQTAWVPRNPNENWEKS